MWLLSIAVVILLLHTLSALDVIIGVRSMTNIKDIPPTKEGQGSLVSVIIPACNEGEQIEAAISALLKQTYNNLEIIAVNDRSSDDTGIILDRLKAENGCLSVIHITELPPGWLGKTHAMHVAAAEARGTYLLFTDGDVTMAPTTIARSVQRMQTKQLDHLTLLFKNSSPSWLLNSLILDAGLGLVQLLRVWRAKDTSSRHFVGVGAFNMVRQKIYTDIGGHASFKTHPIDDIMLGKVIKRSGGTEECLLGHEMVTLPWYASVADMVNGLMKNCLGVINFRFLLLPPLILTMIILNVLPLWGFLFSDGVTRAVFGMVLIAKLLPALLGARLLGLSKWCSLGTLISPYILIYTMLRAAWRVWRDGGVYWRSTFYPVSYLKNNESILFLRR
jgi:glycosyltransferase involved in cell wall biosynthesis